MWFGVLYMWFGGDFGLTWEVDVIKKTLLNLFFTF